MLYDTCRFLKDIKQRHQLYQEDTQKIKTALEILNPVLIFAIYEEFSYMCQDTRRHAKTWNAYFTDQKEVKMSIRIPTTYLYGL